MPIDLRSPGLPEGVERKVIPLELKASDLTDDGSGGFSGYASTWQVIDAYGDRVEKGAYKRTIPAFLKSGFITWGHEIFELPIGTPEALREDDHGLLLRALFHGTAAAQQVRQVVAERASRGLSVGLSIGYIPVKFSFEKNGSVRVLEEIKLLETAITLLPANEQAAIEAIKAGRRGPSAPDQRSAVLAQFAAFSRARARIAGLLAAE